MNDRHGAGSTRQTSRAGHQMAGACISCRNSRTARISGRGVSIGPRASRPACRSSHALRHARLFLYFDHTIHLSATRSSIALPVTES